MGFQGDVAGIGLGELLQGLARGGREGVLTLHASTLGATLGLAGGQLHLLPDPDEDPEIWRRRCERAWIKDPNQRIDTLRMGEIAFAARMERMFELLDCEGVHFRFEPGPLPIPGEQAESGEEKKPLGRAETGTKIEVKTPVLCHPISVEFLLLEYARLSDECQSNGDANRLPVHAVPRLLVQEPPTSDLERFWSDCDGMSNVVEMSDRLGWPLRQGKATLVELSIKGYLRFADARELLVLSQREIAQNNFARAASRLTGWCQTSPPGPPAVGDVQLLIQEWQRGKLPVVLASMEADAARTLLRRIELVDWEIKGSIERWREMRKYHRHDTLSELHLTQWQLRSEAEEDAPAMSDLLKLARQFQDSGHNLRAAVILRAAALRLPENTSVRLEVGSRLIAVGQVQEGAHWVLEACRTLLAAGHAEKALSPLRGLLQADPANREARTLLSQARAKSAAGKNTRRTAVVGLALLVLLSVAALVKVRIDQAFDRSLAEITEQLDDPQRALALLDQRFPEHDSERVATLRLTVLARIEARRTALRNAWFDHYKSIQLECTLGDERKGLQLALELPQPPKLDREETWPTMGELLNTLAARLEQAVAVLPPLEVGGFDSDAALSPAEGQILSVTEDLIAAATSAPERTFTLEAFLQRLEGVKAKIRVRTDQRATEIARVQKEELVLRQDALLAAARTHKQAGDVKRAVENYRRLFATPGAERIRPMLSKEREEAELHLAALEEAERLSVAGDHASAELALAGVCPNPGEHLLPWRVESEPSGAAVILGDGSTRETPFTLFSAIGEKVELSFELAAHEPARVVVERPTDVRALLSRLPKAWWRSKTRVAAPPVPVAGGHIVTNRAGELALLDPAGKPVWETRLESLGGIARTPVFLPGRPEELLILTEEGVAWLVEAQSGRVEGPWSLESPPISGPTPMESGVLATFADGRSALWTTRLKPEVRGPGEPPFGVQRQPPEPYGSDAGLSMLRRSAESATSLRSPWGEWSVEVGDTHFTLRHPTEPERSFHVRRKGEWAYVAWEAPDAGHLAGRLWISDDEGLRRFEP